MGALAEDKALLGLDGLEHGEPDHRRACRPFSDNCGFTLAEASQFFVLFDDALALELGADGYLLKEVNAKDLHDGILETINGGAAMNPSIAMKTLKLLRNPIEIESSKDKEDLKLTTREVEVLEQLSKGLSYSLIADNLILSKGTVRKHLQKTTST